MKAKIPFTIRFDDQDVSGTIQPNGDLLPFGVPSSFLVNWPHHPPMQLHIQNGVWCMAKVDSDLKKALTDWIEVYYE